MAEPVAFGPWIALLLGLALAFFGRGLLLFQLGLLGALLGVLGANSIYTWLAANTGLIPPDAGEPWRLVALLLGAVAGWALASLLRRIGVFVLGVIVGGGALAGLALQAGVPEGLTWLVGAAVGGLLALVLESPLLKVVTAILGGLVVADAVTALFRVEAGLALLVGVAVAVLGAGAQLARR